MNAGKVVVMEMAQDGVVKTAVAAVVGIAPGAGVDTERGVGHGVA